jgi:uncharacterized membrane protein
MAQTNADSGSALSCADSPGTKSTALSESAISADQPLPFAAPCRYLPALAPLQWLRLGWHDLRAAPLQSLSHGLLLTLLSAFIAWVTWRMGTLALYLSLASGFVFIGPFLAMGLYSISYQLEIGQKPTMVFSWREGRDHLRETLVVGMCLLVVLLVWARAATIMNVFRPSVAVESWRDLIPYFGIGSLVGAVFASIVFAATAFSLPMLLDKRTDAVTAVVTSIHATLRNKAAMAAWGLLIVSVVLIGFATALLGFIVLLPLIGHATWHAYRGTIDASRWPSSHGDAVEDANTA